VTVPRPRADLTVGTVDGAPAWRYADVRCVPDIVRHWAAKTPDSTALTYGTTRRSYRELDERSNRIANALLASGAQPGSGIGFLGKNAVEFFETWFGATKAGGAIAPFNWRCTVAELVQLVDDAQPPVVFTSAEFEDTMHQVRQTSDARFEIVSFDPDTPGADGLEEWLQGHDNADPRVQLSHDLPALLAYTSGTTGLPKGVQLSHEAFQNAFLCLSLEPALTWRQDDVLLMVMPNFHLAGSWVSLPALYHGGSIAILPFFEPSATLEAIERSRPTVTCLVPAAMQMLLDHPDAGTVDFSCLRSMIYAGSPISAETLKRSLDLFGCGMNQFYGTTETWILTLLRPHQHDPADPEALTSCGKPMPFVEIRIVDPDGAEVPTGDIGEFIVRSPVMFSGYRNKPDATSEAFTDGWYRTGDLGRRDDRGYFYLVDRAKDMIITGGENVYSVEVERALVQHPSVASVAVVGAPDHRWGEKVVAFVTVQPGSPVSEDDLVSHCRGLIAGYKVPKAVHVVTELPTTPSGKIQKAVLRKRLTDPTATHQ
jgi:acyl-CoA synthetase (AMP-forming)/AMP-acid ligase II